MTKLKQDSIVSLLRHTGLSELACQFAHYVERQDKTGDSLVAISAALLSEAVSQGDVYLDLKLIGEQGGPLDDHLPESSEQWIERLIQSQLVGVAGDQVPLILTAQGRLYLYRYWQDEQTVSRLIEHKCQPVPIVDSTALKAGFDGWASMHELDWQKVAVMMALSRQFSVISGGPGTGKTTIVLHLLQALLTQNKELRIALSAPTGKAAIRLQQAVTERSDVKLEAKTVHRLLGITADNEQGRFSADKPLPVDVLIVDEASMIDLVLMATLMKSLSANTRLVLLGDSYQLSSVESGAVLANLCQDGMHFSSHFRQQASAILGVDLPITEQTETAMTDSVVMLQHSYRFDSDSELGQVAELVKVADEEGTVRLLLSASKLRWQNQLSPQTLLQHADELYSDFFAAVKTYQSAKTCLSLFEQSRILCALKMGPESVDSVNTLIEQKLVKRGWRTQHRFYHGRPIMVTKNDYRQGLFNGDTGLVLYNEQGVLSACFLENNELRWLSLNRLPAHETAFAMSVHKSQGSEFDRVCIVLPQVMSPVLNRALLYTAITRSKKDLDVLANEAVLRKTILTQ